MRGDPSYPVNGILSLPDNKDDHKKVFDVLIRSAMDWKSGRRVLCDYTPEVSNRALTYFDKAANHTADADKLADDLGALIVRATDSANDAAGDAAGASTQASGVTLEHDV